MGWEDPLEESMGTHSSILAWEIPWTEEPGGLQSIGLQRVRHDGATSLSLSFFSTHCVPAYVSGSVAMRDLEISPKNSYSQQYFNVSQLVLGWWFSC